MAAVEKFGDLLPGDELRFGKTDEVCWTVQSVQSDRVVAAWNEGTDARTAYFTPYAMINRGWITNSNYRIVRAGLQVWPAPALTAPAPPTPAAPVDPYVAHRAKLAAIKHPDAYLTLSRLLPDPKPTPAVFYVQSQCPDSEDL